MEKRQKQWIILGALILIALFLRTYELDLTRFEHEMVRDTLAASEVLAGDLKLHGFFASPTSTLQTSLGPTAYYLMAVGTLLMGKSNYWMPLGTILMIALLDALAVLIIYRIGKEFFSEKVGWISAALYAVSPWMILHVATISSPTNFMPFFAITYVYCILKVIVKKQIIWISPAAIAFALMTHFHLTALLVAPGTLLAWFVVAKKLDKEKMPWKQVGLGLVAILILSTPFLYYTVKEKNFKDTVDHVIGKRVKADRIITGIEAIGIPVMISTPYFGKYLLGEETKITTKTGEKYFLGITAIIIVMTAIGALLVSRKVFFEKKREAMVLWIMIATPILLYIIKGSSITVHYFLMILPLPMLVAAIGIEQIMIKWKRTVTVIVIVVLMSNIGAVMMFYNAVAQQGGTTGIYGITYREKVNAAKYVIEGLEKKEEVGVYFYATQKPLRESMSYLLNLNGEKQYIIKTIDHIEEASNGYLIIDKESFYGTYSGIGVPEEDYESIEKMNPIKFKLMEVIEV